ncbi:MAG: hypothetical protein B7C24_18155 [Bacteroidetes bacterium 4572_77]|nr:MAG: hypothetical protein B7C24_18155 [Bacteroidetes bacterium 4572_77]
MSEEICNVCGKSVTRYNLRIVDGSEFIVCSSCKNRNSLTPREVHIDVKAGPVERFFTEGVELGGD